jgi:hypothetical protein
MNWDKAIAFVRQNGNRLDNLRLSHILGEPCSLAEIKRVLALYQFPEGSWDYNPPEENLERIGSLGGAIHCLRWLREFNLGNSQEMIHTLKFLTSIQNSNGSFYETEAKLKHSPQKWLQKETIIDRFYFTAAVPMRLSSLGYDTHHTVEPALHWLEHHWDNWELVTGTWYNVWGLLCSPARERLGDPLYKKCYTKALEWIPHLKALPLTWFLDACHGASFPVDDSLVSKGLSQLVGLQNEKGLWPNPQAPVETTVTALRLLHNYQHND